MRTRPKKPERMVENFDTGAPNKFVFSSYNPTIPAIAKIAPIAKLMIKVCLLIIDLRSNQKVQSDFRH